MKNGEAIEESAGIAALGLVKIMLLLPQDLGPPPPEDSNLKLHLQRLETTLSVCAEEPDHSQLFTHLGRMALEFNRLASKVHKNEQRTSILQVRPARISLRLLPTVGVSYGDFGRLDFRPVWSFLFTVVTAVRNLWEEKEGNEEMGGGSCRFTVSVLGSEAWRAECGLLCSCLFSFLFFLKTRVSLCIPS